MSDDTIKALESVGRFHILNKFAIRPEDFRVLNPSFSLGGEDLILRKIFKTKLMSGAPGYYADIGCAASAAASNTYLFYCYGWSGVCVDANPIFEPGFRKLRPRDKFLCAAVPPEGVPPLYFAEHKNNIGMSRVRASPSDFNDEFKTPQPVPSKALRAIFAEALPQGQQLDFMSVDIEGGELDALGSNDWALFRPGVIVIETTGINLKQMSEFPSIAFLIQQGYSPQAVASGSVIMTADPH